MDRLKSKLNSAQRSNSSCLAPRWRNGSRPLTNPRGGYRMGHVGYDTLLERTDATTADRLASCAPNEFPCVGRMMHLRLLVRYLRTAAPLFRRLATA